MLEAAATINPNTFEECLEIRRSHENFGRCSCRGSGFRQLPKKARKVWSQAGFLLVCTSTKSDCVL